ncbi:ABC transporter ATP-binding protein [Thermodesulfatator autotrophicus]|uniref:ABC transporter ATP-binding protein n=1 Tax=Thermodesulfatator autotrophicus TaxID=1795632 RepID=A0A177E799_9BACT|nr:ABC transporter ATP-binding protein [Thermodesulfatator autotrophicus]OAG27371.1 ABC transporter ATP-binding protein [Thermodesulfatator autotrophicus]
MDTILEVKNLSKKFGAFWALKDVSFTLYEGEILGILGPNGAGKTTLINCLLGLVLPTEGRINYFGLPFPKYRSKVLEKVNFASNYVGLPLSLTLEENLLVYAHLYRLKNPKEKISELLKLFGLWEKRKLRTRTLSSGQMMRLCLAKALLNEPRILLLDEPTAGLDPEIARDTRSLLQSLSHEKNTSIIITSHNLSEIERISDRVLVLQKGQVKALGTKEELLKSFEAKSLEDLYFRLNL